MGRPACWWKEIEVQLAGGKWWQSCKILLNSVENQKFITVFT
jgi:hypothetical protein